MKTIRLFFLATLLGSFASPALWAQDTSATATAEPSKDNRPVRALFENGTLMNNQTVVNLPNKTLEFMIQHRFGSLENGIDDLFGLYGSSNIRLGLDYGFTDRIQVGIGATKNNSVEDLRAKVAILRQTRSGSMPISVSYFFDLGYTIVDDPERYAKGSDRLSYFNQLIIARKFGDKIAVQLSPSYTHFNIVDSSLGHTHDNPAVSFSGRYKITAQSSFMVEYDQPFTDNNVEAGEAKPNLGIGWEIATSSHSFQIFFASATGILPAYNMVYNTHDYTDLNKGIFLGFNITRTWGF